MGLTRRDLLTGIGSGLLLNQLSALPAFARGPTSSGYQALVCVFLFGGNDGNNMIIPVDGRYSAYQTVRPNGGSGDIGIPLSSLVPLTPTSGSAAYGLHPSLSALQPIWNSGDLSFLFNVGTLLEPMTLSDYNTKAKPVPENLFSHDDQQNQMQSGISQGASSVGWGGQIADLLGSLNGSSPVPLMISTGGNTLFTLGAQTHPLSLPASGGFQLNSIGGTYGASVAAAYKQLSAIDANNKLVAAAEGISSRAISASAALNPTLLGTTSIDSYFSSLTTNISQQLHQVAKVISVNQSLAVQRQIFFVSLGGFDTHTDQINTQASLFAQLGPALAAFNSAMGTLGTSSQVTTFSLADFSRTFKPNTGGGSDHGWGNHHFMMGGAVQGLKTYGTFPSLTLGASDDVGEGRWLPSTSLDQYGATLASWFGVSSADLYNLFPNLGAFPTTNLGFLA